MYRIIRLSFIGILWLGCTAFPGKSPGAEAALYVAPDGNDTNPGTLEQPFATLVRARDAARELKKARTTGDITVYFRGGYYHFSETVIFGLEDSGSEKQLVTYRNYPGETPIFTSGVHITGWQRISPDDPGCDFLPEAAREQVYVADIPDGLGLVRHLVDRSAHWLEKARVGVSDLVVTDRYIYGRSIEGQMWDPVEEKTTMHFSRSMEGLSNADDALELRLYPSDYNMNLLPVAAIDSSRLTTQIPGSYRLSLTDLWDWKGRYDVCWIDNLLEGLDRPGEWVWNTRTGKVYLWPKGGTDAIYAPTLVEYILVEGDIDYWGAEDRPVQYIVFDGLTFTNGERAVWEEGDAGIQHDWGMADKANALLRFRGAENCLVRNCTFSKSGGAGVRFDLHARHNTVDNCTFEYLGYEAVHFCGYGIGKKDVNRNNGFVHNEIHHVGMIKWDAPAITIWNSGYNRVAYNYIHHVAYKGVLLSAPRGRAFTRESPMREQAWNMARWDEIGSEALAKVVDSERGSRRVDVDDKICAPYRYLRGNIVEKNVMHDMSESLWGDGVFYITAVGSIDRPEDVNKILDNYVYDTDGNSEDQQTGIFRLVYMDAFGGNLEVHRNVWYNCKRHFEGIFMALWYDQAFPRANVFYKVDHYDHQEEDEEADPLMVPNRGKRVQPIGTLVLDDPESDIHMPDARALEDYLQIYRSLCSGELPGPENLPGAREILDGLEQVIRDLGGQVPACAGGK